MNEKLPELRERANRLPLLPGVYIMKDARGEVIYVGKAKALKNRVSSYFRGEHLPKVAAMADKVDDFDVIVVSSEFEALVLENSLIKRHKPYYNILLKDDKGLSVYPAGQQKRVPALYAVEQIPEGRSEIFRPIRRAFRFKGHNRYGVQGVVLPTCTRKFRVTSASRGPA